MTVKRRSRKMIKAVTVFVIVFIIMTFGSLLSAQLAPDVIAELNKWEDFLKTAKIIDDEQLGGREAVTEPWKLTLEKDGLKRYALWKNPEGRMRGYVEGWKWEIAAYRLDKLLGLNMIPPTIERRFRGDRGSIQLWMNAVMSGKDKMEKKIPVPKDKLIEWNRMYYIMYAFDNLIANEDRHVKNILIDKEWRRIAIDHSRSFRTGKKYLEKLIYTEDHNAGPMVMKRLPRSFFEKLKALDYQTIKDAVEEYLTDKEIEAVLTRRDLIIEEINRRIQILGEETVLY